MKYRKYGYTGKRVSLLGFGGMRFEKPDAVEESAQVVLRAFAKGINYFDTAPIYCNGKSEKIMGEAFKEMKKSSQRFYVSTKSSKRDGGELRRDLETSLRHLGVEAIDFFHCWAILSMEQWAERKRGGAVNAILKAKEEGLIKHAVVSTHLSGVDVETLVDEGIFEGITLGYSAINFPYRDKGLDRAFKRGMGVVVMNPLGGGLIVNHPEQFAFLRVRPEQTMLEAALHFLMNDARIAVNLVGFRRVEDVDSAVAALERFVPYSESQLEAIRHKVVTDFDGLCTTCGYCDVCPEGIGVWKFVETVNYLKLAGHNDLAGRLKWHWGTGIHELERCTECRLCEEACTQHIPVLERFEELKRAIEKTE